MTICKLPRKERALAYLCPFLEQNPSPWHACRQIQRELTQEDFKAALAISDLQQSEKGYILHPEEDSLLAWSIPKNCEKLVIWASHLDSPSLKLKPCGELHEHYWMWSLEPYGGPILPSWVNHPLFLSGRLLLQNHSTKQVRTELVSLETLPFVIEPLAIHFDRNINQEGYKLDRQKHLKGIVGTFNAKDPRSPLTRWMNEHYPAYHLLAHDLFASAHWPLQVLDEGNLICSARIDNLCSAAAMMQALKAVEGAKNGVIALWANHEEIGSQTASGAQSAFFARCFENLAPNLRHNTVIISIDGAHGKHPNWPEMSEPEHAPTLGGGVCVKHNTQGRYRRDFQALRTLKLASQLANEPLQEFNMRSDLPCGSTIGPILSASLGLSSVDIGIAQLGMHAMREVMATSDYHALVSILKQSLHV